MDPLHSPQAPRSLPTVRPTPVSSDHDALEPVIVDYVWQRPRKFQDRIWLHVLLLLATFASTTAVGAENYGGFLSEFGTRAVNLSLPQLLSHGLWYSVTILIILGAHELGHYFACRYYDIDASLPFFIPMPLVLTGTMGAVIRIREPIPSKRMLFDIGIAGPIAGFVFAVPALFIGMALSHVSVVPPHGAGIQYEFGEPLLFKLANWIFWGTPPDGYTLNAHPIVFAAWFGMLATALNLFPVGQFDGGHISYAVLGRKSSYVTLVTVSVAVFLTTFVSAAWMVWTGLMIGMLFVFGRHHPRTFDEDVPLDRTRQLLALFAVLMFALCFTPAPISVEHILR